MQYIAFFQGNYGKKFWGLIRPFQSKEFHQSIAALPVDAFNRIRASRAEITPFPSKSAHKYCNLVKVLALVDAVRSCLASLGVSCPSLSRSPFTATVNSATPQGWNSDNSRLRLLTLLGAHSSHWHPYRQPRRRFG